MARSTFSYAALGAADPIRGAFQTLMGARAGQQMAQVEGALKGAQTAESTEKARGLAMTNDSRQNPFALLEDPQIAEAIKSNPTYANALRVGLGLFGVTGEGNVAAMLPNLQGADLTGQGVLRGNAGDIAGQNRLVAAASGKTYEPFKAVGNTGYAMDAGTGAIAEANPALAALFGQEAQSNVQKNLRANASNITFDPVSQSLIDKSTGMATPVQLQGGQPGQLFGRKAQEAKAEKIAIDAATSDLDRLATAAEALLNAPGLDRITGAMGMFPNVPGSEASNAAALLDTLKSQVGFSVLQAMRAASKTGGALGAVSDKENEMLQNNLAALSTTQSSEQIRKSLANILQYVQSTKQRIGSAYETMYGVPAADGAQSTAATPTAANRQPVRRAVYNGRVIVQYDDGSMEYE